MFFKKLMEPRPSSERGSSDRANGSPNLSVSSAGPAAQGSPSGNSLASAEQSLGLVLDALGGVLTALSRYPLDLPDRSGEEASRELTRWHRHATL
ncbi:MAG: hypothetical protein K2Y26_17140, partial [Gemmatimonadaceae bacterium]|nr:hypothetical protein [Gemmatimonadaceae bacterium]